MFKGLDWFSAIVFSAVIYILAMAIAKALSGGTFDALRVAAAISLLLGLPILRAFAVRRAKPRKR